MPFEPPDEVGGRDQVRAALEDDQAEAIVLGCAGMTPFARCLEEDFGVPVIDGVGVAAKWVEALSTLGYQSSTRNGYAPPRPKHYAGFFERYAP